uniref:Uncharacterized protein n=1 Tax=Oryzias sinensis TaxID=183150 RepID=A0A8C7X147_9TELE
MKLAVVEFGIFGKYLYDAVGQRVRLFDIGSFKNKTFTADVLLHYSDAAMYEIDDAKQTCKKSPLKADFQPLKIPQDAFWLSQTVVGSSSLPGQGLLVNNWHTWFRTNMKSQYSQTWSKVGDIANPDATEKRRMLFFLRKTSYGNLCCKK